MKRFLPFAIISILPIIADAPAQGPQPKNEDLLKEAVKNLIKVQEPGGQWPYQGVVTDKKTGQSPIGYRVGGTGIAATTLMYAAPDDPEAKAAIDRGLEFVLKELDNPDMAVSTKDVYDVRIWGHGYALEFLCHLCAQEDDWK